MDKELPTERRGEGRQEHQALEVKEQRGNEGRQVWAFEYERDEEKRQKKIRISLMALVAVLGFALIFALLFGSENLVSLIKNR